MSATRNLDGPHSDQATITLAREFAEIVRALNYATRDPRGVTFPQTVSTVTGELSSGVFRLDQLCSQLGVFMRRDADRFADDSGTAPRTVVERTLTHLRDARAAAAALSAALDAAQQSTSGLYVALTPDEEGDQS
jgi:hypothetical protein